MGYAYNTEDAKQRRGRCALYRIWKVFTLWPIISVSTWAIDSIGLKLGGEKGKPVYIVYI